MPAQLLLVNPSKPRRKLAKGHRPLPAPIIIEATPGARRTGTKARKNPMARRRRKSARRNASGRFVSTKRKTKSRRKRARRNPAGGMGIFARAAGPTYTSGMSFKKNNKGTRKIKRKGGGSYRTGIAKGTGTSATPAQKAAYSGAKAKRSAAAKKGAATKAANKRKRSAAAKKSAASRKRKGGKASASTTRRRRKRVSKASWNRGLGIQIGRQVRALNKRIRKGGKGKRGKRTKTSGRRAVLRARRAALNIQRRYMSPRGGLSGDAKRMAKAHGLMRVNPSFKSLGTDLLALLPSLGAMGVTAVGVTFVASKVEAQIATKFPTLPADKVAVGVSAGLSVAAYAGARMVKPLSKYASFILAGGAAITLIKLLKMNVGTAEAPMSLAAKAGIPQLGDYVGMDGIVVSNGRSIAVNGMGDYVGVGDYVGMGSIFSGSTLGDVAQLPSGRSADWGLEGEEHVTDFLGDDSGTLSGGIFD